MQGDPDVLRLLNEQLTSELTAINQYFLHSKMQENWGFTELAGHTRAESFDEMRHAEAITDRILLLDGLPNYQRLFSLRIGQTLREQFEADLAIEYDVLNRLKPGVIMCREKQDSTSAFLLEGIIADEENHVDYLETQLQLMDKLGEELYSAQCVSRPPTTGQAGGCAGIAAAYDESADHGRPGHQRRTGQPAAPEFRLPGDRAGHAAGGAGPNHRRHRTAHDRRRSRWGGPSVVGRDQLPARLDDHHRAGRPPR